MTNHPNRSKRQPLRKVIDLLERARECDDRANYARVRAGRHPGTTTMERELALSSRWDEKADKAWGEAMAILKPLAGME
jgi:hypothetical protein